jgi:hypothetical protein
MKGFSPRNLKYMRAFAAAWPERAIVQGVIAQLPHGFPGTTPSRCWRSSKTRPNGWETKLVEKLPKALAGSLPSVEEIEAELSGTPRLKVKGRKS